MTISQINRRVCNKLDEWVDHDKCIEACKSTIILGLITFGLTVGATAFNRMPNCITTRITPKQLIVCSSIAIVTSAVLGACKEIALRQERARYERI